MKKIIFALCFFLCALSVFSRGIREEANLLDENARVSYALGMMMGEDLSLSGFEIDYHAFIEGMRTMMEGLESRMDRGQAVEIVQSAFERILERQAVEARIREAEFLMENALRPGINVTESGLQFEVIEEGSGPRPLITDTVLVHYEATLTDGTLFDSSRLRGNPEEFPLAAVIPGFAEGLLLMNAGSIYRFFIPSNLAYGEHGAGNVIPPYATLIFTVELFGIIED